ncbi:CpaD family pilus assembly protein [Novosphingobium lentum]|uniref:CpaD family pilus assembly protein n=1 Tax=Novosphingobium lentum TaxID=145287 RepID=UPI00082D31F2|nr:CpaD family pilus assembly protein [Novosphingobium lentum]
MPKTFLNTAKTATLAKPLGAALLLSLGLSLGGCGGLPQNRTLESVHQPVVQRDSYVFDVNTLPGGGVSGPEQGRLAGWFDAMDLRYGDHVTVDDPMQSAVTRAAIEAVASRHGILLGDTAPVTAGYVNAGSVRVVVSRLTAEVPHCPDWSGKSDTNFNNATYGNYGCASNSNLAAMVADKEHLIRGATGNGETSIMSSTKAIDSYRTAKPTGEGGLKAQSSQSGGN